MDKKIIKFDDTDIEEYEFHQYKSPISINDIDVKEIVLSNKFTLDKKVFKYFIGYKNNKEIRRLCYSFQIWVYIKDILMRLNVCILWLKMKKFWQIYDNMGKS